jgi:hypothetical protein
MNENSTHDEFKADLDRRRNEAYKEAEEAQKIAREEAEQYEAHFRQLYDAQIAEYRQKQDAAFEAVKPYIPRAGFLMLDEDGNVMLSYFKPLRKKGFLEHVMDWFKQG